MRAETAPSLGWISRYGARQKYANGTHDLQDGEVQNAALEALQVLAAKHGALMSNHYGSLTTILVDLLKSGKAAARKRSIQCLGMCFTSQPLVKGQTWKRNSPTMLPYFLPTV